MSKPDLEFRVGAPLPPGCFKPDGAPREIPLVIDHGGSFFPGTIEIDVSISNGPGALDIGKVIQGWVNERFGYNRARRRKAQRKRWLAGRGGGKWRGARR